MLEDINMGKDLKQRQEGIKHILTLFRKEEVIESFFYLCEVLLSYLYYVFAVLPTLLYDLNRTILSWKKEGTMNPFMRYMTCISSHYHTIPTYPGYPRGIIFFIS